jgi:hypothetical protein
MPKNAWPETAPWFLATDNGVRCFITTAHTMTYPLRPGRSVIRDADAIDESAGHRPTVRDIQAGGYPPPEEIDGNAYWRLTYYGIFSAHQIAHPETGKPCLVGYTHGENKNERIPAWGDRPERLYRNSVLPAREYTRDQYSGYVGGVYRDYWPAYFAFLGLVHCPLDEQGGTKMDARDVGPVSWPADGYIDKAGKPRSKGLRHPSSIIHNGHVYVYYLDTSMSSEPGRGFGIKVARATIAEILDPRAYRTWFDGEFNEPALPEGFTTADRKYLKHRGGRSTPVVGADAQISRFTPTRLKGTRYFLSVEAAMQPAQPGYCEVRLRVSQDLVHWSDPVSVAGTCLPAGEGLGWYPIPVNSDFSDHGTVDPKQFYLIGSEHSKARVRAVVLELLD